MPVALAAGRTRDAVNVSPVSVAGEDRGDMVVRVMFGEAADQLDGVLGQPPALGAARSRT